MQGHHNSIEYPEPVLRREGWTNWVVIPAPEAKEDWENSKEETAIKLFWVNRKKKSVIWNAMGLIHFTVAQVILLQRISRRKVLTKYRRVQRCKGEHEHLAWTKDAERSGWRRKEEGRHYAHLFTERSDWDFCNVWKRKHWAGFFSSLFIGLLQLSSFLLLAHFLDEL